MMLEAGLILSRFLHYASTTFLFGAALYPLYSFTTAAPDTLVRALKPWLVASALISLASLLGWFLFSTAIMAGDAIAMFDSSVLLTVIKTMSFGKLWVGRLALSALLVMLSARWPNGQRWLALLSSAFLVSLIGTGHAQEPEHPYMAVHYTADSAHLVAAGAWLGALWPLVLALRTSPTTEQAGDLLVRFSWMGQLAVGVLIASGLVNSWFLVGSVEQLFTSFYGRLLCLKIGLFVVMLGFAAANRFRITPHFLPPPAASMKATALAMLRRHILAEQTLGLFVLGIVSWLGTLQPPMAG